jgi:hypothetical protein
MKTDPFWFNNPQILLDRHRLIEFVPTNDMNIDERLNSLARLAIYSSILMTVIYKDFNMLYIALISLVITYLIRQNYPYSQEGGDFDDAVQLMKSQLQMPSKQNPFMNVLISDYVQNPSKLPAADVDNPHVKKEMEENFNHGLHRDINDIWGKGNSQRQYYANPSTTIPNDRDSFMKWCYNTPYSCKEGNISNCIYDMRKLSVNEITEGPTGPVPVPPRSI